jgi:uncharacterized protein YydD (DUF2326 family)
MQGCSNNVDRLEDVQVFNHPIEMVHDYDKFSSNYNKITRERRNYSKEKCERRYEKALNDCQVFVQKSDKPAEDDANMARCLRMNGFEGYSSCERS